jgi:hypothetical protein
MLKTGISMDIKWLDNLYRIPFNFHHVLILLKNVEIFIFVEQFEKHLIQDSKLFAEKAKNRFCHLMWG